MLIEITTSEKSSSGPTYLFQSKGLSIVFTNNEKYGKVVEDSGYFNFFTQDPILNQPIVKLNSIIQPFSEKDLSELHNEVTGFSINKEKDHFSFMGFSARISRSRLYFLFKGKSVFLSYDLRKLLPYSGRKLRKEIAYGIIKFGEAPEYCTIIEDIFFVPGGCYLKTDLGKLTSYIEQGTIPEVDFIPYFQVHYPMTGGDIAITELRLKETLQLISTKKPGLLISGGIDSTLLNFLYNEVTDKSYPAIFFHFNEAPEELEYAKQSLQNTKAEFIPVTISDNNLHHDFFKSIELLIYPVYDNGSVLTGYQFRSQFLSKTGINSEQALIDGTLADSCYGVRNYNANLKTGRFQPEFFSYFKEWVYSQFLSRGVELGKTRPRDSFLNDEFLQDLLWYGGPFVNTFFNNAKRYTLSLKSKYYQYVDFLQPENQSEYWPVYTILKLMLYAGKQTTVKTYDMFLPHQVYYPFMFKSILEDQGKYTWKQKSEGNTIKAPLKKILEKHIDKSFIYRKKVGLQSQTKRWIQNDELKPSILSLLERKNGLSEGMMGKNNSALFTKLFQKKESQRDIVSLALSLSVIQYWCDLHDIEVQS